MGEAFIAIGQAIVAGTWGMFSITVPGCTFSFGQMLIGLMIIALGMKLLSMFGIGSGTSYRSGSARNPKISKERKSDEK